MSDVKNTPKLRFPQFSGDWERCKLGEIAKMYSGGTPSISNKAYYGGNIPFIRSGEIYSDKTELFLSQEGFDKSSAKMVKQGDILYALYGATSGEVSRSLINGAINQAILAIIPNEQYESEFISQFLAGQKERIIATYLQGGQGNLSGEIVKNLTINIPKDNAEQTAIGSFFRQIDELITLHQHKLNHTKALKKGLLQKMFPKNEETVPELRFSEFSGDWEMRKLGDFAEVKMCKRIFKEQTTDVGEIPFFKIGTFGGMPDAYISRELFDEYKQKYPYPNVGDILISASGSIGRTVEYQGENAYYQDSNIVWLDHKNKLNNLFLNQFYNIVKWTGLEGSTIQRLYNKAILETQISFPSYQEQTAIGNFFRQLDELIALRQRKLDHLKELKKALLQQMFVLGA